MNSKNDIYDSSWDEDNEDLFDEKYAEWEERDWKSWLKQNLTIPFKVNRVEDFGADFNSPKSKTPFGVGRVMDVLSIHDEDDMYGVIISVQEDQRKAYLSLGEVEVTSRSDPNFWPVREYVVWFANR